MVKMVIPTLLLLLLGCSPHGNNSSAPLPAGIAAPDTDATKAQAKRVAVVVNADSPSSVAIGSYYMAKRRIPASHLIRLHAPVQEEVDKDVYVMTIEDPIKEGLARMKDPIDFIVTTHDVPLRLHMLGYSVDAMIATMETKIPKITKLDDAGISAAANPYFGKNEPFSHLKFGIYLVTRLDGYTDSDAYALVDNSIAATPEKGLFYFDDCTFMSGDLATTQGRNDASAANLKEHGYETRVEPTFAFIAPPEAMMGYVSWGSNDHHFDIEQYHKLKFKPGAIAETYVSTGGRSFKHQTGGQSMIADLVAQGVTGIKGYVNEPYTFSMAHVDLLFARYTKGFNLAESFYMASPIAGYEDMIIGDPLCDPYKAP